MWENVIHPDRSQMALWRMRIASWITKAKYTLRIRHTYYFSLEIMVRRTCRNFTFVTHALPVSLQTVARITQTLECRGVSYNYVKCSLVFILLVFLYFVFFLFVQLTWIPPFAIFITTYFVWILPQVTLSAFAFHFTALSGIQTV